MKLLKTTLFFIVLTTTTSAQMMGEVRPYYNMGQEAVQEEFERAIRVGDLDAVKVFLILGANPNGIDPSSFGRPLYRAIRRMDFRIVEFLLQAGAKVHACHIVLAGQTPHFFELSTEQDFIKISQLLRQYDTGENTDRAITKEECLPSTPFSLMGRQEAPYTSEN